MARRLKKAWFARLTVAAAVLALPLFAAGVASAAIAGANPGTTVGRPDLRAAAITSSTSVEVCFDKGISLFQTGGTGFFVLGYRVDNRFEANSATIDPTNGQCAIVGFSSAVGDINQYTVLSISGGVVTDNLTGLKNHADAVALTFSTTNNGTTGHTTGPDLTGILTPSAGDQANNTLEYTFDQAIGAAPNGTNFYYIDNGGNICWGNAATSVNSTGQVVTVSFAKPCVGGVNPDGTTPGSGGTNGPNNSSSISAAVRGGVAWDSATAANDAAVGDSFNRSQNPNGSAVLPSMNGLTTRPSLVNAALGSTGDSITYVFNTNVSNLDSTDFAVWMSDGQYLVCGSGNTCTATLVSPNTVSVSFGSDLSTQDEYAVMASIFPGAVQPAAATNAGNYVNTYESVNVGDNSGALGRGFTTGADVFGVVFNVAAATVTVDLDQRVSSFEAGDICLLNNAGDQVASPNPVSADIPTQAAGPEAVVLHFQGGSGSGGPVGQASMIAFGPECYSSPETSETSTKTDAFFSNLDFNGHNNTNNTDFLDGYTATQIVAPVGSGARLHAYHVSSKKHHSIKRHKRS